jgi:hypothetical protein
LSTGLVANSVLADETSTKTPDNKVQSSMKINEGVVANYGVISVTEYPSKNQPGTVCYVASQYEGIAISCVKPDALKP